MNREFNVRLLGAWVLGALAVAAATHALAIHAYPRMLMETAYERIASATDASRVLHAPRPDADSRTVVRPSPDILYSVCLYDLAEGPWAIGLDLPDSYTSVSLYAMNTDNFFAVNDRQIRDERLNLRIVPEAVDQASMRGEPLVVISPGDRGIALIRFFAGSGGDAGAIESARSSIRCGPDGGDAALTPSARTTGSSTLG